MKFAIGFVVGAMIGKPVIRLVSRRTGLSRMAEDLAKNVIYSMADSLDRMEEADRKQHVTGDYLRRSRKQKGENR